MDWYLSVLKKYAVFDGRARRKEYWMFFLINLIFMGCTGVIDYLLGTKEMIGGLYSLVVLLPGIGVGIRRLHDIGKSGWFILINLIPIIGVIWFLILMCRDGDLGDNKYGINPKETVFIA
jgi:uncharacterized membrane protein YhaH (DUF805 family)